MSTSTMPSSALAPRRLGMLRKKLLTWFHSAHRRLPWRDRPEPYYVWLSEIMLQQTQVATVVPYFNRFVAAFPTIKDLATADESAVLRAWEGLGYYRRARSLHQAARLMVAQHGGAVPRDPTALAALPGIGRYTLGAILSQAFGMRWPIVDANVARVLARWFGYRGNVDAAEGQRWLWQTAERILPRTDVGNFNQALMELGALTCTPRDPQCLLCPVSAYCVARRDGMQAQIPVKGALRPQETTEEVATVIEQNGRVLLAQRPGHAKRWAGFWEFPHGERRSGEGGRDAARRMLRELTGLRVRLSGEIGVIRHGITRFDVRMTAWRGAFMRGEFDSDFYVSHAWLAPEEFTEYPLSTPQRRLAKLWLDSRSER